MNCSIIVTPSHIVIFEDFIRWIFFTDSKTPMCLLGSVRIQDLKNIVSGHNILVYELLIIDVEPKTRTNVIQSGATTQMQDFVSACALAVGSYIIAKSARGTSQNVMLKTWC